MDIISHILTSAAISRICNCTISESVVIVIAGILPDIGEILIQRELRKKSGIMLTYSAETDNLLVSENIKVTWLYDFFHSLLVWVLFFTFLKFAGASKFFLLVAISGFFHVLLDVATHGKVWALKLFFPFNNRRFIVMGNTLGNWWQWKPFLLLLNKYKLPWYCICYWLIISFLIFI